MRCFRWLTILVLAGLSASVCAQRGIVVTTNDQTFEGELTEDANSVTVTRGQMRTRIARDQIRSIRMSDDPLADIAAARKELEAADVAGRLELSRKAFHLRHYKLARELADEAAALDPNSAEAVELLNLIRRQIAMEDRAVRTAQMQRAQRTVGGSKDASMAMPVKLMDERDMNALRQAELQRGDENHLRVRFANDVRRRFVALPQNQASGFAQLTAFQQAVTIIREGSAEMRQDVLLSGEPAAIRGFRSVQTSVLNGCASVQCHGSFAGGNFVLFPLPESQGALYTNFYLLMKYGRSDRDQPTAVFGGEGARARMIDRQHPERSLLLQYGLPPERALTPHPKVPGFRAMYRDSGDATYRRVLAWVRDGLRPVDVAYEIAYLSPVEEQLRADDASQPDHPDPGNAREEQPTIPQ